MAGKSPDGSCSCFQETSRKAVGFFHFLFLCSNSDEPSSDGLHPRSDGLQPSSGGLQQEACGVHTSRLILTKLKENSPCFAAVDPERMAFKRSCHCIKTCLQAAGTSRSEAGTQMSTEGQGGPERVEHLLQDLSR